MRGLRAAFPLRGSRAAPSSSSASGFPPASSSTRALIGAVNPGLRSSSNRAAASGDRPGNRSSSMPGVRNGTAVSRTANNNASDDPRSSHCASSTTHNSGCSAASSASSVNVAAPTRNGVAAVSLLNPNAPRNAAACGPGSSSSRSR